MALRSTAAISDGVSVETVYCLGNCALGPNALHDGEIFGRLDAQGLDELYASVARKAGERPGERK